MIGEHLPALEAATSTKRVCELLGASRATLYRRRNPAPRPAPRTRPEPPNKLTEAERQQILTVLRSAECCDLAPARVWARLLDDGIYLWSIRGVRETFVASGQFPELLTAEQVSALEVSVARLNRWAAVREQTGRQIGPPATHCRSGGAAGIQSRSANGSSRFDADGR